MFYESRLPLEEYVQTKELDGEKISYLFYLCHGLIEAGDEIRADQCRVLLERFAADPRNQPYAYQFNWYLKHLSIYSNQLLLEQSRFEEVEKNLAPYMDLEASFMTFDSAKSENFNYRAIAAPILARAQLNLDGLSESVRRALDAYAKVSKSLMARLINPKGAVIVTAERDYLFGDYEACYKRIPRGSSGGAGLVNLFSTALDQLYDGSATALERIAELYRARLQALCAYEAGKYEEAKLSYEDLLKLEDVEALKGLRRLAHYHLAQIALKRGQRADAVAHLQSSITALEEERAAIDTEAGRLGYVVNKSDIYLQLVSLLVEDGRDAEAFEYAERGKSRALIDMLATKRGGVDGQSTEKGVFSQALAQVVDSEASQRAAELSGATGGRRNLKIRSTIASENPSLTSLISVTVPPVAQLQQQLQPEETLLEYFGDRQQMFLFVVTRDRLKALRLDAKAINDSTVSWRRALTDITTQTHLQEGQRLHDVLVAPALPYIGSGSLTIVPHGPLHYIPFAALHDGQQFLIQRSDIRLLPSASVLTFLSSAEPGGSGLLILGNPDLGDRQMDLAGAEEEARGIQQINQNSTMLLRASAAETALKSLGPKHAAIHFAMHGKFDPQQPLASGLYMSRDAENDGVLTVRELYDLQLNASLVVLSACETALGETAKGDDVVGLNRGFLFAGVQSIVSSLWEVDDLATRDLMLAFYSSREQQGKAAALRQAQLQVMQKYPHPFYWAAFQINGVF